MLRVALAALQVDLWAMQAMWNLRGVSFQQSVRNKLRGPAARVKTLPDGSRE